MQRSRVINRPIGMQAEAQSTDLIVGPCCGRAAFPRWSFLPGLGWPGLRRAAFTYLVQRVGASGGCLPSCPIWVAWHWGV